MDLNKRKRSVAELLKESKRLREKEKEIFKTLKESFERTDARLTRIHKILEAYPKKKSK